MSKNRFRAAIAGAAIVAGLLAGAGIVYATTNGPDGCGTVSSLSKAVGPNGTSSADPSNNNDGPLCVAPEAPVAPISR
ncbi:MAG TPA: hypothetical protein VGD48_02485 [Kutzneria sp.]|jgi:hypothetical protein